MSIIENGLRADIMRKRMEDKNILKHRGSLYVGTGNKETIENKDVYETTELLKGQSGQLLLSTQDNELQWTNENLDASASLPVDIKVKNSQFTESFSITRRINNETTDIIQNIHLNNTKFLLDLSLFKYENYIIWFNIEYRDTSYYYVLGLFNQYNYGSKKIFINSLAVGSEHIYSISYGIEESQFYIDFSSIFAEGAPHRGDVSIECTLRFIQ